jgi:hypothetical protein
MRKIAILVFIALGVMATCVSAQTLAGYHMFYGPFTNACHIDEFGYQVCSFNKWVDVGNVLQATITNTDTYQACAFAVTAYSSDHYDSLKSNEAVASPCIQPGGTVTLAWSPPGGGPMPPSEPRNLRVSP